MAMNAFAAPRLPVDPLAPSAPIMKPSATMPAPAPKQNAFAAKAAAPMPATPPAQNPFAISQPASPGPLANAFKGFATGLLGVDKINAMDDRYKAQDMEEGKKKLAMLQQFRAMPVEQRMAALPQLSQAIGKEIPPDTMSDQAIDAQVAMMSGQLGIAPATPEPMSAHQAAQIAMEKDKLGRPTPYNLGDGAFAEYDPNADPGKRLNMIRQPEEQPVKYEQFTDASGQVWDVNPYTRQRIKADGMRARVPGEGGAGGAQYRLATPQEVEAAGLPPGTVMKINTVTSEPTILRNPSQTKEYDPVQIRQFKKSVSGLDLLNTTIDEYENTLKNNGGPQNIKGFWNVEQANAIEAARNNTLVLAKELYELGALVGADFSIIEAAIKPATGFESTGQTNDTLGASLRQVKSMLQNKMSQIPEEFVSEVRSNYSGPMANKFNAPPAQPKAAQPSFFTQKFQSATTQMQLPPGVTQEMWDVMDDEDRASFQ